MSRWTGPAVVGGEWKGNGMGWDGIGWDGIGWEASGACGAWWGRAFGIPGSGVGFLMLPEG